QQAATACIIRSRSVQKLDSPVCHSGARMGGNVRDRSLALPRISARGLGQSGSTGRTGVSARRESSSPRATRQPKDSLYRRATHPRGGENQGAWPEGLTGNRNLGNAEDSAGMASKTRRSEIRWKRATGLGPELCGVETMVQLSRSFDDLRLAR